MSTTGAAAQGDPRRPREVHSFIRDPAPEDDGLFSSLAKTYSTLSLACGVAAFVFHWKPVAWLSFVLCGASFANMRSTDADIIRQLSWTIMTATSAMVTSYAGDYATARAATTTNAPRG